MVAPLQATNEQLEQALQECIAKTKNGIVRSWQIKDALTAKGIYMDESTIRGRFITMGKPLGTLMQAVSSGNVKMSTGEPASAETRVSAEEEVKAPAVQRSRVEPETSFEYSDELKAYIPTQEDVDGYIERDIDKRLDKHYQCDKHPITQGKQGTGKTFSHLYYAFKKQIPFMLVSCFEDLLLHKFFGDKSIKDGTVVFKEGILTKMIQVPSLILFDEINAVSNAKSYDFHALLQNRELFIKDANDGEGKIYKLHKKCRIGFAQNPRSAKYIGGTVKPSSFLGRCTYITFPDFEKDEVVALINKKFPSVDKQRVLEFVDFFFEANNFMMSNGIAVDISIRQLINMVAFYEAGMTIQDAVDDGLASILDAISQPQHKQALMAVATTIFNGLSDEVKQNDKLATMKADVLAKIKASVSQPIQQYTTVVGTTVTPVSLQLNGNP